MKAVATSDHALIYQSPLRLLLGFLAAGSPLLALPSCRVPPQSTRLYNLLKRGAEVLKNCNE